jgi:TnpA family transposase
VPSLKFGHATASLLVGKLSASGRQNALAAALKEYGASAPIRFPRRARLYV